MNVVLRFLENQTAKLKVDNAFQQPISWTDSEIKYKVIQ